MPAKPKNLEALGLPNPREWSPPDEDWKLPDNWKKIILEGMRERLGSIARFQIFMDICVRCGACADKCHFFIGSGDPKNMPVLRAELLRSVYRNDFTTGRKDPRQDGRGPGAHRGCLQRVVLLLLPVHRMPALLGLSAPTASTRPKSPSSAGSSSTWSGCNIDWVVGPVANCFHNGNHLGIQPHAFKDMIEFFVDEIEAVNGIRVEPTFNRKGAEILFITPSGDVFADPGTYTLHGLPDALP